MENSLQNMRAVWIEKLQNAKNENEKQIAEKTLKKINSQLGINEIIISKNLSFENNAVDSKTNESNRQKIADYEQQIQKLEKLYLKFKDEDIKVEIINLKKQITELQMQTLTEKPKIEVIELTGKKFYSELLKQHFYFNKEKDEIRFEDGVLYSSSDIAILHGTNADDMKKIHELKKVLPTGRFTNEYQSVS